MRRAAFAAAVVLAVGSTPGAKALADTPPGGRCGPARAAPIGGRALAEAEGVSVSALPDGLRAWTQRASLTFNSGSPVELAFDDGSVCEFPLAAGSERGFAVRVAAKRPRTMDVVVCDDDDKVCLAVTIPLAR